MIGIVVVTGAVPMTGIALVPVCGIVIGGSMTATSLAGRRALDELTTRHGEYEAALSLGLMERDAAMELVRPAARQALVPAMDQTRTVGLVTLPGAFGGRVDRQREPGAGRSGPGPGAGRPPGSRGGGRCRHRRAGGTGSDQPPPGRGTPAVGVTPVSARDVDECQVRESEGHNLQIMLRGLSTVSAGSIG